MLGDTEDTWSVCSLFDYRPDQEKDTEEIVSPFLKDYIKQHQITMPLTTSPPEKTINIKQQQITTPLNTKSPEKTINHPKSFLELCYKNETMEKINKKCSHLKHHWQQSKFLWDLRTSVEPPKCSQDPKPLSSIFNSPAKQEKKKDRVVYNVKKQDIENFIISLGLSPSTLMEIKNNFNNMKSNTIEIEKT